MPQSPTARGRRATASLPGDDAASRWADAEALTLRACRAFAGAGALWVLGSALLAAVVAALWAPSAATAQVHDRAAGPLELAVRGWLDERCPKSIDVKGHDDELLFVWLYRARCLFESGSFDDAAQAFRRALHHAEQAGLHRDTLRDALAWYPELEARWLLHDGPPEAAVRAWAHLLDEVPRTRTSSATRARRLYFHALALERSGDGEGARRRYAQLRDEHPGDPLGARGLPASMDLDDPSPSALMERAGRALRGRHYPAAEQLLLHVVCQGEPPCRPDEVAAGGDPIRLEAAWRMGHLLQRYRREHVARGIPWLEMLVREGGGRQADAVYTLALAQQRAGNMPEAQRAWRMFAHGWPEDRRAVEAAYMLAWSPQVSRDYGTSAIMLEAFLRDHPGAARTSAARWWLGWAHLNLKQCTAAEEAWAPLMRARDPWRRGQVLYWAGVCASRSGETDRAQALWIEAEAALPVSWYAFLSRRRRGLDPVAEPPGGWPSLQEPRLHADLPHRLAALGLHDEAALVDRAFALDGGDLRRARVRSERADWLRWLRRARRDLDSLPASTAALERWRLAYPPFYHALVREASAERAVPPALIRAVIRQESAYDRRAISVSDAMGLMQVIPQTAEAISAANGWGYTDGMLFEPIHAIRYGTWYLGALLEQFQEQIPLAAAAYNAGPIAMGGWLERSGDAPLDRFVEEIGFDQARDYLRRVTTWAVRYAIAHEPADAWSGPEMGGFLPHRIRSRHKPFPDF